MSISSFRIVVCVCGATFKWLGKVHSNAYDEAHFYAASHHYQYESLITVMIDSASCHRERLSSHVHQPYLASPVNAQPAVAWRRCMKIAQCALHHMATWTAEHVLSFPS